MLMDRTMRMLLSVNATIEDAFCDAAVIVVEETYCRRSLGVVCGDGGHCYGTLVLFFVCLLDLLKRERVYLILIWLFFPLKLMIAGSPMRWWSLPENLLPLDLNTVQVLQLRHCLYDLMHGRFFVQSHV